MSYTIQPHESEPIFRLEAEIPRTVGDGISAAAAIEGRWKTNMLRKVLTIYDMIDTTTQQRGASLFSSPNGSDGTRTKLDKPGNLLQTIAVSPEEPKTLIRLNIAGDTKIIIENQTERHQVGFDVLMAGAFSYYGLLAARLYGGEEIYLRTLRPRNISRFVIVD